ncbi:MAG: phytanoyl-CoA dioxygenase family protein [Planctomycetota bacterium]|nr:phytanoyl-CoA dioxygenase family protein [Planctomycetota bacterium]MDA0934406.1 phytanoyl-CoA dioxygenase family protein [Planctomycetota bacterium]MDA1221717.1 phytanoyl-CoA dioxygenase family protein [Planctomycetota bacterium]
MTSGSAHREIGIHRLGAEQVLAFREQGFTGPIPVFDRARVEELRDAVDRIVAEPERYRPQLYEIEAAWTERPDQVVCHFLGGWRCDAALRRAVFDLAATVPCAQVLGVERLRFWHDQVFHKPAHHPGVVPWHQDYSYWQRTAPARHVTLNVMLDDADEDNGCLMFVPGSHRFGLLPSLGFDSELGAVVEHLDDEQRAAFRPVPVPVAAGHATLHHSHTLHGSGPNRSARPRRALVLNYMCADTVLSASDEPLLAGVAPVPAGALVEGECFPVALDLRGWV